jgi:hypothetical protein
MTRVFANHKNDAAAAHDLAVFADFLDGWTDFHAAFLVLGQRRAVRPGAYLLCHNR